MEVELKNSPSDGITRVRFSRKSNQLLVSSWDSTLRLYNDISTEPQIASGEAMGPVLDCCFGANDQEAFASCLNGLVLHYHFGTQKLTELYSHSIGAKCVAFDSSKELVISGGWDQKLIFYHLPTQNKVECQLTGKVFAMDCLFDKLVVVLHDRQVLIYDLSNYDFSLCTKVNPWQTRESSLKYQIRCVRIDPLNGDSFVSTSIEGRVAIDYFSPEPQVQAKKFAFRCHRQTDADGVEVIYPANSVAFHPKFGTFATGGSDHTILIWDGKVRKRIKQLKYSNSIASLDFSADGRMLAIACSYMFEEGEKSDCPTDQLIVRVLGENDCKPKS